MARVQVKAPRGVFVKFQTKWARWPGLIEAHRCGGDAVVIEVTPSWRADQRKPPASEIVMSAHEAQAFAAWLSEQAEHLISLEARKEARAAASRKRKEEGRHAD
jgi:hypothetical protein